MRSLILTTLTALVMLMPAATRADDLGNLQKSFMARYDEANARRDEQLQKLDTSYLGALARQLEKTKSSGNLDAVLPIVGEMDAIKARKDPLPSLPESASLELKQIRGKHAEGRDKILKSHAEALASLADKMEGVLKTQEAELTKAGKIDEALVAKHMRESLAQDPGITSARDLVKSPGLAGNDRPALRLRRYGDNLEVLVFPDRSGKVSMDSPVQNVREETGEHKQLGETKAKLLGEFVGAKGYTVDPFIAYHQVFDGKDPGNFILNEIVSDFRHEADNKKGLKLSFKPAAKDPWAQFGDVLPPTACKGSFRITTRYNTPKSNRIRLRFGFVHGIGNLIGEKLFEESGKWTSEEVIGSSSFESKHLLLYPKLPTGKTIADAASDYIVLGEIKVEHIAFTAFLMKNFDPAATMSESIDDPLKQPLFIINGEFIEK